jgi:hypothetical protein
MTETDGIINVSIKAAVDLLRAYVKAEVKQPALYRELMVSYRDVMEGYERSELVISRFGRRVAGVTVEYSPNGVIDVDHLSADIDEADHKVYIWGCREAIEQAAAVIMSVNVAVEFDRIAPQYKYQFVAVADYERMRVHFRGDPDGTKYGILYLHPHA